MSGAEHINIGSAQFSGLNETESESVTNVNVEPLLGKVGKDSGCVMDSDVGGDSSKPILAMGKEMGMLDNEVQTCDTLKMGIGVSNCSIARDGLTRINPVAEHDGGGTRTSNCGNVETLGHSLIPTQVHVDVGGGCCGVVDDYNASSTCENEVKSVGLGNSKSLTYGVVEGNEVPSSDIIVQAEKGVRHMQAVTGEYVLGAENQTCGPLEVEKSTGQESVKIEMSEPNVVADDYKPSSSCKNEVKPVENLGTGNSENLIHGVVEGNQVPSSDIAVQAEKCVSRMQAATGEYALGNESRTCEPSVVEKSTGQESVKCEVSYPNVVVPNIVGSETVSEGLIAKDNSVKLPSELKLQNGSTDTGAEFSSCVVLGLCGQSNQVEQKEDAASKADLANVKENQDIESSLNDGAQRCLAEEVERSYHGMSKTSGGIMQLAASDAKDFGNEQRGLHFVVLAIPAIATNEKKATTPGTANNEKPRRGRRPGKRSAVPADKKYALRSSVDNTRASRSRSPENAQVSQPSTILENSKGSTGRKRGRKKKGEMEGKPHDEYGRMRKHLRYLLHRIRYEQNLLDAYSSEGWRGQSLEKLRPEKELQRAKADIIRSKMKIRDLFQRLDSMSAEGKFPDSMYDSEGLIDSEDIFCAKCGSTDLSPVNDIILCDGACDRGFHQYCLEPPLRTEEIPPGDEGWLCPACDCKVDCLDLLNDSQVTKLSIQDSWQKVFPEAAAAMAGNEQDDIMGLPSDDSEDNDFNPDGSDDDGEDEGNELSSDESDSSDFSSASEDLGAITGKNEQYLGLPSDDSEDDDYNPDVVNVNENVEHETSSSDFTSASENLGPADDDDGGISGNLESELPLLEPDQDMGDSPSVSGRRHVERLDYKKLYDETYGNATSDSSDDEEWADVDVMTKGKCSTKKGGSVSSNADALVLVDNTGSVGTPKRRGRKKKLNPGVANGSPAQLTEGSQKTGSSSKGLKRPPYNKLGEAVTQRLYESFKENQYPDRQMKEKLANELGLTPEKINKWFGNARWSYNHHRERIEASMATAASHSNTTHNDTCNGIESASANVGTAVSENGIADSTKMDIKESDKKTSVPKRGRKRKQTEDEQSVVQSSNTQISIEGTQEAKHEGVQKRTKAGAE